MATKTVLSVATDAYSELAKQFRLAPIKNDKHLKAAHEMIDRLMQEDLDPSAEDYLGVLAGPVENYERRRFPIGNASDIDVLRELIRASGLSQNELAKKVRISQSTISNVLKGTRKLTKDQVIKFAAFFNVSPAAFLSSGTTGGKASWSSGSGTAGSGHGIAAAPRS